MILKKTFQNVIPVLITFQQPKIIYVHIFKNYTACTDTSAVERMCSLHEEYNFKTYLHVPHDALFLIHTDCLYHATFSKFFLSFCFFISGAFLHYILHSYVCFFSVDASLSSFLVFIFPPFTNRPDHIPLF